MITSTLLFLFYFFSAFLVVVGMFFRMPVVTIAGGATFMFCGLASLVDGVGEYDGSYNVTSSFNASNNVTEELQTPNYNVTKNLFSTALSLIYIFSGVATMIYGATYRKVE